MMKVCKKCGEFKEHSEYYNQQRYADRLDPMCKVCRKLTNKAYHEKNRDVIIKRVSKWRDENVERIKERSRLYYQKNKEKIRLYYLEKRKKNSATTN
jgi:hypothetical protein